MPATVQRSYRLTPESVDRIEELRKRWSQGKPLSAASVVNEAIDRAWEAEARKQEPKPTKSNGKKTSKNSREPP